MKKSYGKRRKRKWQEFFETKSGILNSNANDTNMKSETIILEKIKSFLKNFSFQSGQYKLVWIIRIALWATLMAIAVCGFIL